MITLFTQSYDKYFILPSVGMCFLLKYCFVSTNRLFVFKSQCNLSTAAIATAVTVTAVAERLIWHKRSDRSNHCESGKRGSGVLSPLRYESGKPMTGFSAGCRQKVTVVEPLTPPDRIAPMAPAEHREPATPPRIGNGFADATSETLCRSSVFFIAVA